jgi:hypothetical protein
MVVTAITVVILVVLVGWLAWLTLVGARMLTRPRESQGGEFPLH